MAPIKTEYDSGSSPIATIISAAKFAADKHRNQRRKDKAATPYINHPLAVASILANEANVEDTDIIVGALLHDTVEDTETSPEEIRQVFGARVAEIVEQVTDDKALPKLERKQRQIASAPSKTAEAKLLKLADKIANLRDIANHPPVDWSIDRQIAYFDFAEDVARGLTGLNPVLDGLFEDAAKRRPTKPIKGGVKS